MSVRDHKYLIIGGVPKAGTTSLFKYLSDHPSICASSVKETRFFLDPDYPLFSPVSFNGSNLEEYEGYFRTCKGGNSRKVRMEATPDYLYSENALRISDCLPQAQMVFILRDQVDRMLSWYKYARLRGFLSNSVSFAEYVQMQRDVQISSDLPVHLRALEQGKYFKYINRFMESMKERILILSFDRLKTNPAEVMETVCEFSGLDKDFYRNYNFTVENASSFPRSRLINKMYFKVQRDLSYYFRSCPLVLSFLKMPNRLLKCLLEFSRHSTAKIDVPPQIEVFLREYYEEETSGWEQGRL